MYLRYAERQGWTTEGLSMNDNEGGGIKEAVVTLIGDGAYGLLKFESGVHRVQRIPETESNGRIHTSAATVAVLPEAEDVDVDINDSDLSPTSNSSSNRFLSIISVNPSHGLSPLVNDPQ